MAVSLSDTFISFGSFGRVVQTWTAECAYAVVRLPGGLTRPVEGGSSSATITRPSRNSENVNPNSEPAPTSAPAGDAAPDDFIVAPVMADRQRALGVDAQYAALVRGVVFNGPARGVELEVPIRGVAFGVWLAKAAALLSSMSRRWLTPMKMVEACIVVSWRFDDSMAHVETLARQARQTRIRLPLLSTIYQEVADAQADLE